MKIESVRFRRVTMPRVDSAWRTASYAKDSVEGFIVEITAGGMTGIGGTAAHPNYISGSDLAAQIEGPVKAVLLGGDPLSGNVLREAIRQSHVHSRCFIAADLALYDLAAKLANLPCHALWGGAIRPRVKMVRMVGIKSVAELESAVAQLIEQGIRHIKVKVGTGVQEDTERVRTLRKTFGESIWIAVDGNGAYAPDDALRLSQALLPYDVGLIEQPIDYRNLDGLATVTAESLIPIMADQCVFDVQSAVEVCQKRAAHIVSIKAAKMGSLDECRRVFEVCRAFGVRVHVGGSAGPAVVDVAMGQLAASLAGIDEECEVGEFLALKGEVSNGATVENGCLEVSKAAGWGLSYPNS